MAIPAVSTSINVSYLFDPETIPDNILTEIDNIATGVHSRNSSRSKDKITLDALRGVAAEIAFTRKFPQFCRHKNPPYAFDVASLTAWKGSRIEIKCPRVDKDWWVPVNYDHFYNHAQEGNVDFICNAYIEETTGDFFIKAIANAKSFESYVQPGPYNMFYNHHRAVKDGECWIGSQAVNKIKKVIEDNKWEHF